MIRFVSADVRYVGICDDCGDRTEPTSMASAHLALNSHFQSQRHKCDCDSCLICGRGRSAHGSDQECPIPPFEGFVEQFVPSGCRCAVPALFGIDTREEQVFEPATVGCVCAGCAPGLAAARKAALDAEIGASRRRRTGASRRRRS